MFKTWLQTFASAMGITLVGFLASVIVARALGPEGRGLLGWAMLIATLSASMAQLGLGQAFVYFRRTQLHWNWPQLLILASVVTLVLAGSLTIIVKTPAVPLAVLSTSGLVAIACALALGGLLLNVSQLESSLRTHNTSRFTGPALFFIGLLLAWQIGVLDVQSALWIQLAASIGSLGILLVWTVRTFRATERLPVRSGLRVQLATIAPHAFKLHGIVLLGIVLGNVDKIYLLVVGSVANFGLYTVAFASSRLIGTIQETLATTVYSRYAGQHTQQAAQSIQLAFRLTLLPMLVLAALIGALGPHLLGLVFGSAFASAGLVFAILLIECVATNSGVLLSQQFNAAGRPGLVLARQMVSMIPIVVLLPFVPSSYPLEGVAAVLLVSASTRLAATLLLFKFALGQPIPSLFPARFELMAAIARFTRSP
jgi:O-antigen/teichoic acid export membrane protein